MEGDDDELKDSDCLPRLLEDVQSVHVCCIVKLCARNANLLRRFFEGVCLFHSAPPIV